MATYLTHASVASADVEMATLPISCGGEDGAGRCEETTGTSPDTYSAINWAAMGSRSKGLDSMSLVINSCKVLQRLACFRKAKWQRDDSERRSSKARKLIVGGRVIDLGSRWLENEKHPIKNMKLKT